MRNDIDTPQSAALFRPLKSLLTKKTKASLSKSETKIKPEQNPDQEIRRLLKEIQNLETLNDHLMKDLQHKEKLIQF